MNYPELKELTAIIKDTCPQQGFSGGTLDIWLEALEPYALADCQRALKSILTEHVNPYTVPLGALLTAVQGVTSERAEHLAWPSPPDGLNVGRYLDWKQDEMKARRGGDQRAFLQKWYGSTDLAVIEARQAGRPVPGVLALEGGEPVAVPERLYHGYVLPDGIKSLPEADAWVAQRQKELRGQMNAEAEKSRQEQIQALVARIEQDLSVPDEEEPTW